MLVRLAQVDGKVFTTFMRELLKKFQGYAFFRKCDFPGRFAVYQRVKSRYTLQTKEKHKEKATSYW